ncbi:uncharacterized protein PWA37_004983 [Arxiozyma heterogenica]|uniref:uncharacterized protein n=1 Tax=Arxiozyma heterogenica TaxID=278026 RepID=UPI002F0FCD19
MPGKETLKLKKVVLRKLIKLIKTPLLKYMDVLSNILKGLETLYFNGGKIRQIYPINIIEKFKHIFYHIKRSIIYCSNLNEINVIYNEFIEFLSQFDSFNDQSLLMFFQPLIVKFDYFRDFFQSFRVINDIYEKFPSDTTHWNLKLQKEIQWYITFQEELLKKLVSEPKISTNQFQNHSTNHKPKYYRQNVYIKDV